MALKKHTQLPIPSGSSWDKKTYNPYFLFNAWLYNKFPHTWFYKNYDKFIQTPISSFIGGVKSLIRWLPIIWKDRNWDSHYTLEILKHKLILQREYLVTNNRFTTVDVVNRDITLCLNLIERLQDDFYEVEYQDYYEEDMWFEPIEGGMYSVKSKVIRENLQDYFDKYPLVVSKIYRKHPQPYSTPPNISIALQVGTENHERCKRLLFKVLQDKIEHWWD